MPRPHRSLDAVPTAPAELAHEAVQQGRGALRGGGFDRGFWPIFGLALALDQVAIWATRWLPMGDLGGWIELLDVVARYDSRETVYSSVYSLPAGLDPNSAVVLLGGLLGRVIPVDLAAKVFVALYALGMPLAVLFMCRAFGRSRWLALFAAPMVFNALFNVGLLNYLVALPLVFATIGLARRYADERRLAHGVLLALAGLALFYAHVLAFLFGASMAVFVLAIGIRRRRDVLTLWPLLPALLPCALWVFRKYVMREASEGGAALADANGVGFVFESVAQRLRGFSGWGLRFFRDQTDTWAAAVLLGAWLLLMIAPAALEPRPKLRFRDALHRHTLELLGAASMIAYLALPSAMREIQLIAERLPMQVLLLLVAWPRHDFATLRQRALLVPVALVAIGYPVAVHAKFREYERDYVGEVPAVIAALPDRSRLAYILWEREIDLTYMGPLWHLPKAVHAMANGGITNDSFAIRPHCPVQFQPGEAPRRLPERFFASPALFDYDWVLLRSAARPRDVLGQASMALRYEWRGWWLFEVVKGARGPDVIVRAGGEGGEAWYSDCRGGPTAAGVPTLAPLEGLGVVAGERVVNALAPRCREADVQGASAFGDLRRGVVRELRCDAGEALVGLFGRAGSLVDSLGLVCRAGDARARGSVDGLRRTERVGGDGGVPFEILCPTGLVATGLRGRAGAAIDQLGLACSAPMP